MTRTPPMERLDAIDLSVGTSGKLGAKFLPDGRATFRVWAPNSESLSVHLVAPQDRIIPMTPEERGYYSVTLDGIEPGTLYFFQLSGGIDRPDPASRCQPQGVHGPSAILDVRPLREENWRGLPLREYVIYELHVGAFTPEGTLDAIIPHLYRLQQLGVTVVELMPLAEFPGARNWGYDGVYPFAVHHRYGGVEALQRLARACHQRGMALALDVVYNHFGPEGNYLSQYGPYFTSHYRTPWGDAINFDGAHSDEVRRLFIENALYWVEECGLDALRLDAIHEIYDRSAYPFLRELADAVRERASSLGRHIHLIAETDQNDARIASSPENNGYGIHAQWSDDFHHALHALLTGEQAAYYVDFGELNHLSSALEQGWVYSGQYSAFRKRRHGNSPDGIEAGQLVVFSQNHDQIGNRMLGERLIHLVGAEKARLAASAVILSPFLPLLFMGEEYGEPAAFLYHVSHTDEDLQEAVRRGRREEFKEFLDLGEPPDPQDELTFRRSKLNQSLARKGKHALMHDFYEELLRVRKTHPAFRTLSNRAANVETLQSHSAIVIRRGEAPDQAVLVLHFCPEEQTVPVFIAPGEWRILLNSADHRWGGPVEAANTAVSSGGEDVLLTLAPWSCMLLGT